jgi:hypothetical protein
MREMNSTIKYINVIKSFCSRIYAEANETRKKGNKSKLALRKGHPPLGECFFWFRVQNSQKAQSKLFSSLTEILFDEIYDKIKS